MFGNQKKQTLFFYIIFHILFIKTKMKKIFLAAILLYLGVFTYTHAQEEKKEEKKEEKSAVSLESEEGVPILPEEGDWSLGISANPFLNYLGNFFNQAGNNQSPSVNFVQNPFNQLALFGKLVKDENTAYRGRFQLNVGSTGENRISVKDELPAPSTPNYVTDKRNRTDVGILLAFGLEKRRGAGRLQGVYGGEFLIGFASSSEKFTYGNAITNQFQNPTTSSFAPTSNNILGGGGRVTQFKYGNKFMVGARGFIGVEYFFAPKMSIGGEFGYAFTVITAGKGSTTSEVWNPVTNSVQTTTADVYNPEYRNTRLGIGLDNLNGAINLLFYF
jgi:hypothetical protein